MHNTLAASDYALIDTRTYNRVLTIGQRSFGAS